MPIPNSAYGIILIDNLEVYKQFPIVYVRRINLSSGQKYCLHYAWTMLTL